MDRYLTTTYLLNTVFLMVCVCVICLAVRIAIQHNRKSYASLVAILVGTAAGIAGNIYGTLIPALVAMLVLSYNIFRPDGNK